MPPRCAIVPLNEMNIVNIRKTKVNTLIILVESRIEGIDPGLVIPRIIDSFSKQQVSPVIHASLGALRTNDILELLLVARTMQILRYGTTTIVKKSSPEVS